MNEANSAASASTRRACPLNSFLFGAGAWTFTGDLGLAIMRIGIGLYMALGHGMDKMFGPDRFGPSEDVVSMVAALDFPAPTLFAWLAALSEFVGGLALAAGLFTRPAALTLIGTMAVAAFLQHSEDPWVGVPGKEFALLYMLPAIALLAMGGGRFSVDGVLRKVLFCKR